MAETENPSDVPDAGGIAPAAPAPIGGPTSSATNAVTIVVEPSPPAATNTPLGLVQRCKFVGAYPATPWFVTPDGHSVTLQPGDVVELIVPDGFSLPAELQPTTDPITVAEEA